MSAPRFPTEIVRAAEPADLPGIVGIYNQSIPARMSTADLEPVTVEGRRAWFDAHTDRRPLWVVEVEGAVAAWLSVEPFYGRAAYDATVEVSVYVASGHRARGLGRRLLGEAIDRGPGLGIRTLVGFVFAHNRASVGLFEQLGFAPWGRLPQVARLDGEYADLVILGRRIAA